MPHRHDSTSFVPPVPYGDVPYIEQGPPRANVVIASNQASDWRMVILSGVFLTLMTLAIWITAHYGFGIPQGWAAVAALVIFAVAGRYTLIITNGDWLGHRQINANERVDTSRIDAQSESSRRYAEYMTLTETNRHAEEVKRIEAQTTDGRLRNDVAWLVEQVGAMRNRLPLDATVAQPIHAFVPGKPDEARRAVGRWLLSLWDSNGERRFVPGQLPMPWNSNDWRGKPWCDDARRLLLDSGILVPGANGRTFAVVPASMRDAMAMLDAGR